MTNPAMNNLDGIELRPSFYCNVNDRLVPLRLSSRQRRFIGVASVFAAALVPGVEGKSPVLEASVQVALGPDTLAHEDLFNICAGVDRPFSPDEYDGETPDTHILEQPFAWVVARDIVYIRTRDSGDRLDGVLHPFRATRPEELVRDMRFSDTYSPVPRSTLHRLSATGLILCAIKYLTRDSGGSKISGKISDPRFSEQGFTDAELDRSYQLARYLNVPDIRLGNYLDD